jgi:hypothetical protein
VFPGNPLPDLRLQFDLEDLASAEFGLFHKRPRRLRFRASPRN